MLVHEAHRQLHHGSRAKPCRGCDGLISFDIDGFGFHSYEVRRVLERGPKRRLSFSRVHGLSGPDRGRERRRPVVVGHVHHMDR